MNYWDNEQRTLLGVIREAYRCKRREYATAQTRAADELILMDAEDGRTDLALGPGDYDLFVDAGYLRERTRTFGGCTGTVMPAIMAWDAQPPPSATAGALHVSGHGNSINLQHGTGNQMTGVTSTGGSVRIDDARQLRDALSKVLAVVPGAAAVDVLGSVDAAIDAALNRPPAEVKSKLDSAIERAAKLGTAAGGTVAILRLIAAACGVPIS